MPKEALFGCLALAAAVGLAESAVAGPITWSYQWEALGVPYQDPIDGQPLGPYHGINIWSGNSGNFGNARLNFDQFDPTVWQSATGAQSVVATRLNFWAVVDNPSAFFQIGYPAPGDYTLTLHLRDDASGQTGQLAFHGQFSGDFGGGFGLQNQFVGPTTETLDLGGHHFTVTVGPVTMPTILFTDDGQGGIVPGGYQTTPEQAGKIDASIEVADSSNAPEPASLALAGMGLLGAAAVRWRRRRAATA